MRVYLAGPLTIETGDRLVGEREFPSKQGLLVAAYLVVERRRPVSKDALAEVVWGPEPPAARDSALSAIVSKLRALLSSLGLGDAASITGHLGTYQMRLPPDAWVDVEAARQALDEAEGALRAGDLRAVWPSANIVISVARRPFLPGIDAPWAEAQRERMRLQLVRGLDCLSEMSLRSGQTALAVQHAKEALAMEPLRELGYQRLMQTHLALGDRAAALRVYEQCRTALAEELGADPSPQTEAIYLSALGSER